VIGTRTDGRGGGVARRHWLDIRDAGDDGRVDGRRSSSQGVTPMHGSQTPPLCRGARCKQVWQKRCFAWRERR